MRTPRNSSRKRSFQVAPKIKAEDNPWYLLATLYGVPKEDDFELRAKNRAAWNRYFAANLDEETRTKLVAEKRLPAEELRPFSPKELQEVATTFAERCKASAKNFTLPASGTTIDFSNVGFEKGAFLHQCLFPRLARFDGATFSDLALFLGTTFSGGASFDGATFSGGASFDGATFSGRALFRVATFSGDTSFGGATFSGLAHFDGATFSGLASLVNVEMKWETSFKDAIFEKEPPRFFNAKLHQGTVWRDANWPLPKNKNEAGAFIDAYACLKLEMDRLKKHGDELDFFARELQSSRVRLGPWRGFPFALYGLLSNYGRSYIRPVVALFVVAAIGAGAFSYFDARDFFWEALALSAANTLNVFGVRRDFNLAIDTPLDWLKVFAAAPTIFGTTLLFLIGLGIRNKFRMK
jgi:uncharacterized protein YjbI with pentapeptide repeats